MFSNILRVKSKFCIYGLFCFKRPYAISLPNIISFIFFTFVVHIIMVFEL